MIIERHYPATERQPARVVRAEALQSNDDPDLYHVERLYDHQGADLVPHGRTPIGTVRRTDRPIHDFPSTCRVTTWTPRSIRGGNLNRANSLVVAVQHLIDRFG